MVENLAASLEIVACINTLELFIASTFNHMVHVSRRFKYWVVDVLYLPLSICTLYYEFHFFLMFFLIKSWLYWFRLGTNPYYFVMHGSPRLESTRLHFPPTSAIVSRTHHNIISRVSFEDPLLVRWLEKEVGINHKIFGLKSLSHL